MSNLLNKIFNGGLEADDQYYDDDQYEAYDDDDSYDYEDSRVESNIININGDEKSTVVLIEPKDMHDACEIIKYLKENKICVGKFDLTNAANVQNIVDFISGAVYALNADMEKISDEIFVVTPANVEIKKTRKEEKVKTSSFSFGKR